MEMAISAVIVQRLCEILARAGEKEVGGMLMGREISRGCFEVVEFSVDETSGSYEAFRRDPAVHNRVLDEFFERTGRDYAASNYLGEWHSHPCFLVTPSRADLMAMRCLVEEEDGIPFAALLILRQGAKGTSEASATLHQSGRPTEAIDIVRAAPW